MTTKVLNLYAGIGGNRKLWDDVDVTAVEIDRGKAQIYLDYFPNDEVVVADAHEYLKDHHEEYDFIWASPPCPTHSRFNHTTAARDNASVDYPDMKLWQEVIYLQEWVDADWVVENVITYYDPLIEPQERGKHYFWSNFHIPEFDFDGIKVKTRGTSESRLRTARQRTGFDLSDKDVNKKYELKMLNNAVTPELGKHVFEAATKNRQATLDF